jgi:hypothetical protein
MHRPAEVRAPVPVSLLAAGAVLAPLAVLLARMQRLGVNLKVRMCCSQKPCVIA